VRWREEQYFRSSALVDQVCTSSPDTSFASLIGSMDVPKQLAVFPNESSRTK
jgi:hypothetical protein